MASQGARQCQKRDAMCEASRRACLRNLLLWPSGCQRAWGASNPPPPPPACHGRDALQFMFVCCCNPCSYLVGSGCWWYEPPRGSWPATVADMFGLRLVAFLQDNIERIGGADSLLVVGSKTERGPVRGLWPERSTCWGPPACRRLGGLFQ
jgi:hypothetical protein